MLPWGEGFDTRCGLDHLKVSIILQDVVWFPSLLLALVETAPQGLFSFLNLGDELLFIFMAILDRLAKGS